MMSTSPDPLAKGLTESFSSVSSTNPSIEPPRQSAYPTMPPPSQGQFSASLSSAPYPYRSSSTSATAQSSTPQPVVQPPLVSAEPGTTEQSSTETSPSSGVKGPSCSNQRPRSSQKRNYSYWQQVRLKRQRLLLLRHACKCQYEAGQCPVTPHCAFMKRLWEHLAHCRNHQCSVKHCMSSRYVLSHYHRCNECPVCAPVRQIIRFSNEREKMPNGSGKGLYPEQQHPVSVTADMAPPLPYEPQPKKRKSEHQSSTGGGTLSMYVPNEVASMSASRKEAVHSSKLPKSFHSPVPGSVSGQEQRLQQMRALLQKMSSQHPRQVKMDERNRMASSSQNNDMVRQSSAPQAYMGSSRGGSSTERNPSNWRTCQCKACRPVRDPVPTSQPKQLVPRSSIGSSSSSGAMMIAMLNSSYLPASSSSQPHSIMSPSLDRTELKMSGRSGLTEQRKEQQRIIQLHVMLFEHASLCISPQCAFSHCAKMKSYLQHGRSCKVKVNGGCKICKRIWTLLRIHAQKCIDPWCQILPCAAIRERIRPSLKQQKVTCMMI